MCLYVKSTFLLPQAIKDHDEIPALAGTLNTELTNPSAHLSPQLKSYQCLPYQPKINSKKPSMHRPQLNTLSAQLGTYRLKAHIVTQLAHFAGACFVWLPIGLGDNAKGPPPHLQPPAHKLMPILISAA